MSYEKKWENSATIKLGVRNIKSNVLRRSIMITCFLPVLFLAFAWNVVISILGLIASFFICMMTLGESVYAHWNYHGDNEDRDKP